MEKTDKIDRYIREKYAKQETIRADTRPDVNLPERKFRAGAISSTIWANKAVSKDGREIVFRSVSLDRSYTDKEGKWQTSSNLRATDLPKAALVLQKAYEYIVMKNSEAEEGA